MAKGHPLRTPWELQQDGDLWQIVWTAINARGPNTAKGTNVKAHATLEQVQQGEITEEDHKGNGQADKAATKGTDCHAQGIRQYAAFAAETKKIRTTCQTNTHNYHRRYQNRKRRES